MREKNGLLSGIFAPHRHDVDGMRAVAVLTVLAYHAGIKAVPGGFVGVDVFFVISGFVITQALLRDIHINEFSIAGFYERRIRRILPALLAVMAATFVVSTMYSLPTELVDLSKSMVAATLSASNVYFWMTGGYFSSPALTRPLLHTWSLAVEEQFYLVWPVYLWIGSRYFKRHLLAVTVVIIGLSFATAAVGAFSNPSATFYLVHTRAWELLLGSVIPLGAFGAVLGPRLRNALAILGLALILISSRVIHSSMPFPGLLALPPCLGTFLLILAGRDGGSLIGRILSLRPIVFFGLISYSVYLWHWPVIVFQINYGVFVSGGSNRFQKLIVIACALALGALSWKFIEQPFRMGKWRPARKSLFIMTGTGAALIILAGIVAWNSLGFPSRYSPVDLQIAAVLDIDTSSMFRSGKCFLFHEYREPFAAECLQMDETKPNYLLLGDSHAAQLWFGLTTVFTQSNFLQATAASCIPVVDHGIGEAANCIDEINDVLNTFLPQHKSVVVVLAARWREQDLPRIEQTLIWLRSKGTTVVLVGPVPIYMLPMPRLMIMANRAHDPALIGRSWDHSSIELDKKMAELARRQGVPYVSPIQALCSGFACAFADDHGQPFLSDDEHFTPAGSVNFARSIRIGHESSLQSMTAPFISSTGR